MRQPYFLDTVREVVLIYRLYILQEVSCQYDNGRTDNPNIDVELQVYVKVGEDDTNLTFGQGTSEEPRPEVADNIKAQLEKRYGEGKVSQQPGNKFTVPAPPSPTPPDDDSTGDGTNGGRNEISF